MAYVVAGMFFFCVITFVTVCTEVDATQERSHTGNHNLVVVMVVQVNLLIGCGSMVNNSVEMLSRYHIYLISYQETLKRFYIFDSFHIDVGVPPPWRVIPTPTLLGYHDLV
jgi:hypothetical protein